jgi:hypothetical protein
MNVKISTMICHGDLHWVEKLTPANVVSVTTMPPDVTLTQVCMRQLAVGVEDIVMTVSTTLLESIVRSVPHSTTRTPTATSQILMCAGAVNVTLLDLKMEESVKKRLMSSMA